MSSFTDTLLSEALGTLGTHEEGGKNRGYQIDMWNRNVGAKEGSPWCAAWVYSMFALASAVEGFPNPCPKTAGALKLWHLSPENCRTMIPARGDVFVLDTGDPGGYGHVGIVEFVSPDGRTFTTVEGNTNESGSREGNAVAKHTWRDDGKRGKLLGFITLDPTQTPEYQSALAHGEITEKRKP